MAESKVRVVIVDDSIVRGTTSRKIVRMVRGAGAREVHVRISSPPIHWPCYYGIDTPTRKELIASSHSVAEIARRHGVNANLLFSWRRQHEQGVLAERTRPPRASKMLPVHVATPSASSSAAVVSTIEIELPCGARVRLTGEVIAERLAAVLSALARR